MWPGSFANYHWRQLVCASHVGAQHQAKSVFGFEMLLPMHIFFLESIYAVAQHLVKEAGVISIIDIIGLILLEQWHELLLLKLCCTHTAIILSTDPLEYSSIPVNTKE